MDLDALLALAGAGLSPFAEAVFAEPRWFDALRDLAARPSWPASADALVVSSGLEGCAREYPPKERCVLEVLLAQLGARGEGSVPLLEKVARSHPQRELRIYALHGLLGAGTRGVDAAAGPPGALPEDRDTVAHMLRARAALERGDSPALVARDPAAAGAALRALAQLASESARRASGPGLLEARPEWLAFVVEARFDRALAASADAVLERVPEALWKPLHEARKREERARKRREKAPKKPTKAERAALDAELTELGAELRSLVKELGAEGYRFVAEPLEPPDAEYAKKLAELEAKVGAVPLVLARFWALVGAVDLRGNHPRWARKTWVSRGDEPCWFADPLALTSLQGALTEALDSSYEVRGAPAALRYELALAGDEVTKANFSGGVVRVCTPCATVDAPLLGREGTLLGLLREGVRWGGFPGFARVEGAPVREASSLRRARRRH